MGNNHLGAGGEKAMLTAEQMEIVQAAMDRDAAKRIHAAGVKHLLPCPCEQIEHTPDRCFDPNGRGVRYVAPVRSGPAIVHVQCRRCGMASPYAYVFDEGYSAADAAWNDMVAALAIDYATLANAGLEAVYNKLITKEK